MIRDGIKKGPDIEGGTLAWFVGALLWWKLWAGAAIVAAYLWATLPYFLSPLAYSGPGFLASVAYTVGLLPWLAARPLRLLATLPLAAWMVQWLRRGRV